MKSIFNGAALFVAVACPIWIAVLWRWRATQHDLAVGEVVLYLAMLPIVVFALVLAARWAVRGALVDRASKAAVATGTGVGERSASAIAPGDETSPAPSWHLQGAWAHTAGGASVEDLLGAIEAGAPRPRPDASLNDDEGLPVMTARIAGLELDDVCTAIGTGPDGRPPSTASGRAVRALASLAPLMAALGRSLTEWAERWDEATLLASAARQDAPAERRSAWTGGVRNVRVLAAWPNDWNDETCAFAQAWLAAHLCDPLADRLPLARWTIQCQRMSGAQLLSAAQRTLDLLQGQGRDDPVVLMACHSDLDALGIRGLEAAQRLFHSARRPKVSMPGEGAAVLVLSALPWPGRDGADDERIHFQRPVVLRRSASIEGAGRPASDETVGLVGRSLAGGGVAAEEITRLASDADQHTARATELFAVTLAWMPGLDANDDLRLAGTVAGRLEAVAPLLTLAMAAAQARESRGPALALSLADTHWRMAAVACPTSFKAVPEPA